jgi:hypothetical protein
MFCTVSRAVDAQNATGPATPNVDALRQKMTLQNRIDLMRKMQTKTPQVRTGLSAGMQPIPAASVPGPAGHAPANAVQPDNNNTDAGDPYGSIAARNVFGLNPIPPPAPPADPNAIPPPKITLTGITTIFGPAEALYKVAAYVKSGKQVAEQSYILTEGEAQDEIEVTAIDTQKDIVTFNNHNQTQVIPLANGVASGGDSGSGAPSGGPPGIMRRFGGNFPRPGGGPGGFQPRAGGAYNGGGYNNPNGNNVTPAGQMNNNGSSGSYNNTYNNNASSQPALSPDDQAALIAAQHAQAIADNNPAQILYPQTPYDGDAGIPPSSQPQTDPSQTGQTGGPTLSPDKIARLQAQAAAMGYGPAPGK